MYFIWKKGNKNKTKQKKEIFDSRHLLAIPTVKVGGGGEGRDASKLRKEYVVAECHSAESDHDLQVQK